jgi:peptidoglycan/LPS O-acetylase OafA/YrhL
MRQLFKNIRVIGKNRYEAYASVPFVVLSVLLFVVVPSESNRYEGLLIGLGAALIGFILALNALTDAQRINITERVIASVCFCIGGCLFLFDLVIAVFEAS